MKCTGDPLQPCLWCCGRVSLVLVHWTRVEFEILTSDGFPLGELGC